MRAGPSTSLAEVRRRRREGRVPPPAVDSWPPGPGDLSGSVPASAFEPARQAPYTLEEEERAALHRLVFSQPEPSDAADPGSLVGDPSPPAMRISAADHSGLHMAAESSGCGDLPMHYITPLASGEASEGVSGMLSWGAGYERVWP